MKTKKIERKPMIIPAPAYRPRLLKKNREGRSREREFQEMLEAYLAETAEDLESYPVRLPVHGQFWDNGYEDIG